MEEDCYLEFFEVNDYLEPFSSISKVALRAAFSNGCAHVSYKRSETPIYSVLYHVWTEEGGWRLEWITTDTLSAQNVAELKYFPENTLSDSFPAKKYRMLFERYQIEYNVSVRKLCDYFAIASQTHYDIARGSRKPSKQYQLALDNAIEFGLLPKRLEKLGIKRQELVMPEGKFKPLKKVADMFHKLVQGEEEKFIRYYKKGLLYAYRDIFATQEVFTRWFMNCDNTIREGFVAGLQGKDLQKLLLNRRN
jgi:hypothetical protein